jgi:hypothetical protein
MCLEYSSFVACSSLLQGSSHNLTAPCLLTKGAGSVPLAIAWDHGHTNKHLAPELNTIKYVCRQFYTEARDLEIKFHQTLCTIEYPGIPNSLFHQLESFG